MDKLFLFILFAFCTIDLPSPIIVYGTQIIGITILSFVCMLRARVIAINGILLWMLFAILFTSITYIQTTYIAHAELIWNFYGRIVFWFLIFIILKPYIEKINITKLSRVLNLWILIYSCLLFLQFIAYYAMNITIDYSILLQGEPSRIFNDVGLRASGLASEPSIYSGIMISLLSLSYIINKKTTGYSYLGLISIFLTFSTLGVILGVLYLIITMFHKLTLSKIVVMIAGFSCILIFLSASLVNRYDKFNSGKDISNNVKIQVIDNFIDNENILLLGYGVIGSSETAPLYYQALYDLTLFGNLIIIFGLPLGVLLSCYAFYVIISSNFSTTEKLLIFISLVKITIPNAIFFYLFVLLLCSLNKKNTSKDF